MQTGAVQAPTPVVERSHPLHRFAGRIHQVLDTVDPDSAWSLSGPEAAEAMAELYAALPRLQALGLAALAEADRAEVAADNAATGTPAWLRSETRITGPEAHREVKLARALEEHDPTRAALASGVVNAAQAAVVVQAVDALPDEVDKQLRIRAEQHLLAQAAHHDSAELKRLGQHLVDVIDPDGADERLARQLEREERRAARTTFLTLSHDGKGRCDGRFRTSSLRGDQLERLLHALTNPDRPDPMARQDAQGRKRPTAELLGEAFEALIDRYPVEQLPKLRGRNATVVVTMTLDTLLGGLGAATLDTGRKLSPGEARRLAADAGLIPAVLGGDGAVLDLGPEVRFHTPQQRLTMSVQQDGRCAVEDCDRPAWWCDAAHLVAHHLGGRTSVEDGALVCPRHHQLADSPRYRIQKIKPGRIRLIRRQ